MLASTVLAPLNGGGDANGQLYVQRRAITVNNNGAIRRLLAHPYPLESLWQLRTDDDMAIAGCIGNDSSQCLIEPATDAIEAVVHATAHAIPVFPRGSGTLVEHIEIARKVVLLQQRVHPVGSLGLSGPLCNDRHAH